MAYIALNATKRQLEDANVAFEQFDKVQKLTKNYKNIQME